ncbi:MAG: GNAT family N-acetyltransferase [Pyrinomonadaceae bacterium]
MRSEIVGEKVVLRKYETDFIPLLFEAAAESKGGEFSRWMPWCHENYTIEESKTFVEESIENWESQTEFNFAIFSVKKNEFCGIVSLNVFNSIHKFYNLGYWVRTSCQNQGIASEAVKLLARAAFEDLPINRIEILAAAENIPSQKAAEKSGAAREAVLRKRLVIGDRIHDAVMFSFVRGDFTIEK